MELRKGDFTKEEIEARCHYQTTYYVQVADMRVYQLHSNALLPVDNGSRYSARHLGLWVEEIYTL